MIQKRCGASGRLMTAIGMLQTYSIAAWHPHDGSDRWGNSFMSTASLEYAIEMLIDLSEDIDAMEDSAAARKREA